MVGHVKLEIAIQIVAEKIADIYQKIENTMDYNQMANLQVELKNAFDERDRVARGEIVAIEKILKERGSK